MEPKRSGNSGRYQGFELTFREGVVVGDMRPAVSLGDAQIGQEQGNRFGGHGGSAIGVDGELVGADVLLTAGFGDEPLGQLGAFTFGDHPADDETAEDVQDHVKVEVGPLDRAQQLGDVPTPDLVGGGGQQLGFW